MRAAEQAQQMRGGFPARHDPDVVRLEPVEQACIDELVDRAVARGAGPSVRKRVLRQVIASGIRVQRQEGGLEP